jgi:hypothetical protein
MPDGILREESQFVLEALYKNYQLHRKILDALSTKRYGLSKNELEKDTGIPAAGTLPTYLNELLACDFISEHTILKHKRRNNYYRVIDEFTLFAKRFMNTNKKTFLKDKFLKIIATPSFSSWCGYSFESLCNKHSNQLLEALSIAGMHVDISSWDNRISRQRISGEITGQGFQLDMLLERADSIVNICEIKYSKGPYLLSTAEAKKIKTRQTIVQSITKRQVSSILISASEVISTPLLKETFTRVITGEDLFCSV